jgi:hypothetical protein
MSAVLIVLCALGVSSCALLEPEAAHQLNLSGTEWQVVALDGDSLAGEAAMRVEFPDLDTVIVRGPCGESSALLAIDTDGSAIGFGDFTHARSECTADEATMTQRVLEAVGDVDSWRVIDQQTIELEGTTTVRLER